MTADSLWRIALRFLRAARPEETPLALMSNEDVDQWLEEHRGGLRA